MVAELIKSFANRRLKAPLYTWRDTSGHEIDILIDLGQRLIPVEVKSGETVPADATQNLTWWTNLPGNPNQHGLLVHGGTRSFRLENHSVYPWHLT